MNCDKNWCISNIVYTSLSGLLFLISSYQTILYFKSKRYSTKRLKTIIVTTNILTLLMTLHFLLSNIKYITIFVLMEFCLYLYFCLIAMFYVKQASSYLEDSSFLIKTVKNFLFMILCLLVVLFVYFLVIVSLKTMNYTDCTSIE